MDNDQKSVKQEQNPSGIATECLAAEADGQSCVAPQRIYIHSPHLVGLETKPCKCGEDAEYTHSSFFKSQHQVYLEFLAQHDECSRCGNALCRGTELFPLLEDGDITARCWNCLTSTQRNSEVKGQQPLA